MLNLVAFKCKSNLCVTTQTRKLQLTQHLLVIEVMSLAMHLVLQSKVESDVLHYFFSEGPCAGFIFLLLDVLDHIWEPHRQSVVAAKCF